MVRVDALSSADAWKVAGLLPREVAATAAAALSQGGGLVAVASGVAGPFTPDMPRACAILNCGAAVRPVYRGEGHIVALAVDDRFAFAVRSVLRSEGTAYAGIRSDDAGATWREAGPVRAVSINRLAVSATGLVIVTGGNRTMAVSRDFGANWRSYRAPVPFSSAHEFPAVQGNEAAIAGWGLRALTLAERAEVRQDLLPASTEVMSLRAGCASLRVGRRARLATLGPDGIYWGPDLAGDRLVLAVARPAPALWRVLMRARDPERGAEFVVSRTHDHGQSWLIEEPRIGPVSDICAAAGVGVVPATRQVLVL